MNSSIPLVSVCIPAFNTELFIADTIKSVLNQTYPHLEIIVSDDCSTDNTTTIVEQYSQSRVKLLHQPSNLGMTANFNASIRASSGKYVLKLDSDDLVDADYIYELVSVLEKHPSITFAHCACRLINAEGEFLGYERSIHGSFIRTGQIEWPRYVFGPRAVNIVILRRSAFDSVGGYDERFAYSSDWKMHRDLLRIGDVYYNDRVLASYRVHTIGKSHVRLLLAQEHLLHIEDMERNWPPAIQNKRDLIRKCRMLYSRKLIESSAQTSRIERERLLAYLPAYGTFLRTRLLALFVRYGGASVLSLFGLLIFRMRQYTKLFLYKD